MTVRSEERPTPWHCAHCSEEVEAGAGHICPAQFAEPWLLGRLAALEKAVVSLFQLNEDALDVARRHEDELAALEREVAALAARLEVLEEKREGGGERPE